MAVGDDNDFLKELYPKEILELIVTEDPEISMLIAEIEAIKKEIKVCEKQQAEKEATLKAFIGDSKGIISPDYCVSWKAQTSTRIDTDAIKAAGLYEKFSKTTETRVLRITKTKGTK
jgi:predicted phage-related endonuclease